MSGAESSAALTEQILGAAMRVQARAVVLCGVTPSLVRSALSVGGDFVVINAPPIVDARGGGLLGFLEELCCAGMLTRGDVVVCVATPSVACRFGALAVTRIREIDEVMCLLRAACEVGRRVKAGTATGGEFRYDARRGPLCSIGHGFVGGGEPVARVSATHGRVCVESAGQLLLEIDPFVLPDSPSPETHD